MEDHHDNFLQLTNKATTSRCPVSPSAIEFTQAATGLIMTHIAHHHSTAGGRKISESQLKILCNQAKEGAVLPCQPTPDALIPLAPMQSNVACYKAELQAVIDKHRESILQLSNHGKPTNLVS
jgi:hypothetical protein